MKEFITTLALFLLVDLFMFVTFLPAYPPLVIGFVLGSVALAAFCTLMDKMIYK